MRVAKLITQSEYKRNTTVGISRRRRFVLPSRRVAFRFAATLSQYHYIRRRNGPSFSMSAFFLCTARKQEREREREREVWRRRKPFQSPPAQRCKKSYKVNFMPHRSPLARTPPPPNDANAAAHFRHFSREQRGISRALKAAVDRDRGRRELS